jgi:hypothetical protein
MLASCVPLLKIEEEKKPGIRRPGVCCMAHDFLRVFMGSLSRPVSLQGRARGKSPTMPANTTDERKS